MPALFLAVISCCFFHLGSAEMPSDSEVSTEAELVFDPANHSIAWSNFISCYWGVFCNGTVVVVEGRPVCDGSLQCMSAGEGGAGTIAPYQMHDASQTSSAQSSLLVCHHGSYCCGSWEWSKGRRQCKGGLRCQNPGDNSRRKGLAALRLRGADKNAQGAVKKVEHERHMVDEGNTTLAVANFLLCWYGSYCPSSEPHGQGPSVCSVSLACLGPAVWATSNSSSADDSAAARPRARLISCAYGTACVLWYASGADVQPAGPLLAALVDDTVTVDLTEAPSYQLSCLAQAAAKLRLRAPGLLSAAADATRRRAEAMALTTQERAGSLRG
eukprot:s3733_g2.t3